MMTISHKNNPLRAKAHLYLKKEPKNGSILLNPKEHTLEFYPVGHIDEARQPVFEQIWDIAVSRRTENDLYPLGDSGHNIRLVCVVSNIGQEHVCVVIESPMPGSILSSLDGSGIGLCPARINKEVYKNHNMFKGGRILKIRAAFHKKYFTAKVIFGYGKSKITNTNFDESSRFFNIAEEIQ